MFLPAVADYLAVTVDELLILADGLADVPDLLRSALEAYNRRQA